jgi:diguanylate cyclase (GGDEF)-like protein
MHLFPICAEGEVLAAIAILDHIDDNTKKKQISRICRLIAPQMEILHLKSEVEQGGVLSTAVRRFSESLKRVDADDFWLNATQNAAEMLRAERASLMTFDEKKNAFEIRALIGAKHNPKVGEETGGRVAKIVFAKNEPIAVTDVSKTGLSPAPQDRQYKTSSFLSCPISIGGLAIGVMNFTDRAGGEAFDTASLDLFQAIAPQLAVAIDRAILKDRAGEFEQLSVTDTLTGLLNRRYMEARLLEEVKRSNRHGYPMSFMMLDVDDFKSYNDAFGHPAGDVALKLVGYVIRETLRGADVAARFGGEEFSILLPQTTVEEAAAIAERIRANIEHTDFPHRRITTSIGIASCSAELCASADLISAADKALYEAKRQGRNLVLSFENLRSTHLD